MSVLIVVYWTFDAKLPLERAYFTCKISMRWACIVAEGVGSNMYLQRRDDRNSQIYKSWWNANLLQYL